MQKQVSIRKRQKSLTSKNIHSSNLMSPILSTNIFKNKNFSIKKINKEQFRIINERFNFNRRTYSSNNVRKINSKTPKLKFSRTIKLKTEKNIKNNYGSVIALNNILVKNKKKRFLKKNSKDEKIKINNFHPKRIKFKNSITPQNYIKYEKLYRTLQKENSFKNIKRKDFINIIYTKINKNFSNNIFSSKKQKKPKKVYYHTILKIKKLSIKGKSSEIYKSGIIKIQNQCINIPLLAPRLIKKILKLKRNSEILQKSKSKSILNKFSIMNIKFTRRNSKRGKFAIDYLEKKKIHKSDTIWIRFINTLLKGGSLEYVNFIGYYDIKFGKREIKDIKFTVENVSLPFNHLEYFFFKLEKDFLGKSYYF